MKTFVLAVVVLAALAATVSADCPSDRKALQKEVVSAIGKAKALNAFPSGKGFFFKQLFRRNRVVAPTIPKAITDEFKKVDKTMTSGARWIKLIAKKHDSKTGPPFDAERTKYLNGCMDKAKEVKKDCQFIMPGSAGFQSDIDVTVDGNNPAECLKEFMKHCSITKTSELQVLTDDLDTNFYPLSYVTGNKQLQKKLGEKCYTSVTLGSKQYSLFSYVGNPECVVEKALKGKMTNHGSSNHIDYLSKVEKFLGGSAKSSCDKSLGAIYGIIKFADEAYHTQGSFVDVVAFQQMGSKGDLSKAFSTDGAKAYFKNTKNAKELHWQSSVENTIDAIHYISHAKDWKTLQSKSKYVARALCSCAEYDSKRKTSCLAWNTYVKKCRKADDKTVKATKECQLKFDKSLQTELTACVNA